MSNTSLKENEYHPSAHIALDFIKNLPMKETMMCRESISSAALSGDRMAEVCDETWNRLDEGEPVSDRYVMGLAWMLYSLTNE